MRTTVGQLLINDALPEDLRDHTRVLNKKGVVALFTHIAEKHPEKYRELDKRLSDIGRDVSYTEGSSITLDDLSTAKAKHAVMPALKARVREIVNDPKLNQEEKDRLIVEETGKLVGKLSDAIHAEGLADGNNLSHFAESGARGSSQQVGQMRGSPLLVTDNKKRVIPIPITSSYSEGLDPVELWASSYGVRSGYVTIKSCLAAGTTVLMANGTEKVIEQVKAGDVVMGADLTGNMKPSVVVEAFDNGKRPCFEFVFRKNRTNEFISVQATDDHKVLARYKCGQSVKARRRSYYAPTLLPLWKAATRKHATDNCFTAVPPSGWSTDEHHEPYALMLGLMLGDGCMTGRTYTLSCADQLLVDDISTYLSELHLGLSRPASGYSWCVRYGSYDKFNHGPGRHPFVEFCKRVGCDGKLAREKTLPAEAWSWSDTSLGNLLAGLFSTDGCIKHNKNNGNISIVLQMTSQALVQQVKRLLELRFGVCVGPVRITKADGLVYGKHDQYSIAISQLSAVVKFSQKIRLVGRKRRKLEALLATVKPTFRNTDCGFKSQSKTFLGQVNTYDLHVDNQDHLFVLGNGLIVSNSTPKAGFFGKQLANAAHRLVVVDQKPLEGTGLMVETQDPDTEGSVLARDYGPLKAGTVLLPHHMKQLRKKFPKVLVYSSIAAPVAGGGVPQVAAGVRERGGLSPLNDQIGIAASQAIAEPLSQALISSKHIAGVVGGAGGRGSARAEAGFDVVNRMANIPKYYPGRSPVAEADGHISRIEPAPQGGHYVFIGDIKHYVDDEQDLAVKPGQAVEAGDSLGTGMPGTDDIVRHKGIGEGRRYFLNEMRRVMKNSGVNVHRRNLELMARSLINHVQITGDNMEGHLPDDIVEYDDFAARYTPRPGSKLERTKLAKGRFLEQPVLHYSIGTRLTPRVMQDLHDNDVKDVMVHDEEPDFTPRMSRAMDVMSRDPDWMTRMGGFYLGKNTLDAVHRGASSKDHSTSYVPSLAKATEFGKTDKPGY
jgi:hypothetical protein